MILGVINKFTALFLTFVILANNINNVIIVTDFIINQEIIAKTLCIQKENQKGCMGKCQLKKELTQNNTSKDSNAPLPVKTRYGLDTFVLHFTRICPLKNTHPISKPSYNCNLNSEKLEMQFYDIDTPPPILS